MNIPQIVWIGVIIFVGQWQWLIAITLAVFAATISLSAQAGSFYDLKTTTLVGNKPAVVELTARGIEAEIDALAYFDPNVAKRDYSNMPESAVLAAARNREGTARVAWSPYMHNPKLKARLRRIDVPTLILWGTADRVVLNPDYGHTFAAAIPGARLETIERAGHYPHIEQPDEFAREVDAANVVIAVLHGLAATEAIVTIIVGWPLNTSGSVGAQAERVNQFIQLATQHLGLPILKRDERHTSQAVQREQSMAQRKLPRGAEDSLVAQLLVESYLTEIS